MTTAPQVEADGSVLTTAGAQVEDAVVTIDDARAAAHGTTRPGMSSAADAISRTRPIRRPGRSAASSPTSKRW